MSETTKRSFIDGYISFLGISVRDGKIGPSLPAMTIDENNQLSIFCLMVSPQEAMGHMAKYIQEKKPMEAAFGLDRFSKENQGVDKKYDSVFTIYYMNEKKEWAIGIFPYNEAGEFGEVDWDNTFWKGILSESIETFSQLSKEVYDE